MGASMKAHAIYGPPGTGKTTELMRRITALRERGIDADAIGFLSHTRAAAAEALTRLELQRSDNVSTLHALCFRLLKLSRDMVVDRKRLAAFAASIGVPMKGGNIEDEEATDVGDDYIGVHTRAVCTFGSAQQLFARAGSQGTWAQCKHFIDAYETWKTKHGYVDFNDMLLRFAAQPVPHGARVLLIDEAQDLSPLQWKVIDRLCAMRGLEEVHVAGDDDQAIFVWGGADPQGMVQFEQRMNAERVVLPQSWRVPLRVHKLAQRVIVQVRNRVHKQYEPRDEEGTISEHSDLYGLDLKPDESTLVLARTGSRKREIERHLVNECVPYLTEGGYPGLLQNRTARALRVLHALRRGESINADSVTVLQQNATAHAKPLIEQRNFAEVAQMDDERAINIPSWHTRYYRKVDVDAKPSVRLMTIHASKGREADRVVLDTSLTQRVCNGMVDDPDSEARVFYVGVTRTRHRLDIVHGKNGYLL